MIRYWPSLITNSLKGFMCDSIVKEINIVCVIEPEDTTRPSVRVSEFECCNWLISNLCNCINEKSINVGAMAPQLSSKTVLKGRILWFFII